MVLTPATIRHNNPGAMWPGPSAKKFGSTASVKLNDGQGNKIATFPTAVAGAAAQFDLLARSYAGLTVQAAITKWTGGNSPEAEMAMIDKYIDLQPNDVLTRDFLQDPTKAIPFAKGMAENETGRPFPLSDDEWMLAHTMAFPPKPANGAGNWMELARSDLGVSEVAGARDNPLIMQWYTDVGHPEVQHDEVPNCAAFVGSKLKRAGMSYLETLTARDYRTCGTPVMGEPQEGDIAIFWRNSPSSWEGHVAFVVSATAKTVKALGANQGNKVSVASFPRSQVLEFRRPIPAQKTVLATVKGDHSLKTMLAGITASVVAGLTNTVDVVTNWFGDAFSALQGAQAQIEPVQQFAMRAGIPWPAKATLIILTGSVLFLFIRDLISKRAQ